tara:strand:- start:98 stop:358 length:261 start_codon:yes stop_codon:yes gene_type:complete
MVDVSENAALLANAFLKKMGPCARQLIRCRTDLNMLYEASEDAWWPDDAKEEAFSKVLYAMSKGDLPDTKLRVVVRHGWEISWRSI